MTQIILCDIDDTVANLFPEWMNKHFQHTGELIQEESIPDWDIWKYSKYGKLIYQHLKSNIYENVLPIEDSLDSIKELRSMKFRVVFLTSNAYTMGGTKYQWLNDNGFDVKITDYIESSDKSIIFGHYLIDDRFENVRDAYGTGVLYTKSWNKQYDYNPRCNNWKEVVEYIKTEESL